jgi:hypothetical protein
MTIEFWPRRLLRPSGSLPEKKPKKPRTRRPKLPISAGKAQQMLSSAILLGDDEYASWIDAAVKRGQVLPKPRAACLEELKTRLDRVMQPLSA